MRRYGVGESARRLIDACEIAPGRRCIGVVGAQDAFAVGEGSLVQRDCLGRSARRLIGAIRSSPGRERIRVIAAKDPQGVGDGSLEQRDGAAKVPGRLIGAGEVVPRAQGVGVRGRAPAPSRRRSPRAAGWRRRGGLPQRRRRRGCSPISACSDGRGRGSARHLRGLAEERERPVKSARRLEGVPEVVPGGKRAGVARAENPVAVGQGGLESGMASPKPPAAS